MSLPWAKQRSRYEIAQVKGDKVNGAFLLPMRKVISRTTDICVGIEEPQKRGGHEMGREGSVKNVWDIWELSI